MQETAPQYIQRILGYVEGQDAIKVQRGTASKLKKLIQGTDRKAAEMEARAGEVVDQRNSRALVGR